MRYRAKVKLDANHKEICDFLKQHWIEVVDLSSAGELPDLLIRNRGAEVGFLEIKVEGSKAKWTRTQLQFIANTKLNVQIAKTPSEALHYAQNIYHNSLLDGQKNKLAGFLATNADKFFQPSVIEKVLRGEK